MSRYQPPSAAHSGYSQSANPEQPLHDRDPSPSDSESSSAFNSYPDPAHDDAPAPDDPYHALTSQTLNADGTPKRPMNAFMIFARKRRPQISAANQMMRTGDVSKILSKEWNTMEMSEKKFYLDQAKKLKDNFNSKYPDYVYRRRPNNSRKKRRPDPAHEHDADGPAGSPDADPDDASYEDPSPVDPDDPLAVAPHAHDLSGPFSHRAHGHGHGHGMNASPPLYHPHDPACSYPYASDFHPHPPHAAHHRLAHLHGDPSLPSSIGPVRTASLEGVHPYPSPSHPLYPSPHSQQQTSHLYGGGSGTHGGLAGWEAPRTGGGGGRTDAGRASWPVMLPALDTNVAARQQRFGLNGHPHPSHPSHAHLGPHGHAQGNGHGGKADAYSPTPSVPARPWSSATSSSSSSASHSASASASASASGTSTSNSTGNAFPTLNSAFFPHESLSPASKALDLSPPPPPAGPSAADYYAAAPARRPSQESPYGSYAGGWPQQQQQYGRPPSTGAGGGGRLSMSYSPGAGPGAAGADGARPHLGYWDDRLGGR